MLNKLLAFMRRYDMVQPGDTVICAVSGGADSVALLWALYLLREKMQIRLEAAHFNHNLRGEESQRDEDFVRALCERYDIALHVGRGAVTAGKKGLEAAAREARYAFLQQLPGKIATAHTADDNAETVLMHMVRGTGLKGLGGISPVRGRLFRPMLSVTREDVLSFLDEYNLCYVQDGSNDTDQFLRNRLRHYAMPALTRENPRLAQNLSAMALRLREDESQLEQLAASAKTLDVEVLRKLPASLRNRVLASALEEFGVPEPAAEHITLLEDVVNSDRPSAKASFPGGITIGRNYGKLEKLPIKQELHMQLPCPGTTEIPSLGIRVVCTPSSKSVCQKDRFTVVPNGRIILRSRRTGDAIRLPGGTKSLKKLFIDVKIPASRRSQIPVIADDTGILGVYGFGANQDRLEQAAAGVEIRFEIIERE